MEGPSPADLLAGALRGEPEAWRIIVERYSDLVWSVARSFGLDSTTAADVSQTAWLKLVQHGSSIRDASKVGSWLATTTANEARRVLRSRRREAAAPVIDESVLDPGPQPDESVIDAETTAELRSALGALPADCWQLLRLLAAEPPLSYEEIGEILGKPVGSIGPTRRRCLDRLRGLSGV
jgi:RNA polymerase sigma factor (sigma-70 family)